MYNYLLRLVNEPAVAEEILQEVFLALWRGAQDFRAEATVKTWLLRIAHHRRNVAAPQAGRALAG